VKITTSLLPYRREDKGMEEGGLLALICSLSLSLLFPSHYSLQGDYRHDDVSMDDACDVSVYSERNED
jgi:hypothetical protein